MRNGLLPLDHRIDLETVRETLTYFRDDMATASEYARVAAALRTAISEIDAVLERELSHPPRREVQPTASRFVRWNPFS